MKITNSKFGILFFVFALNFTKMSAQNNVGLSAQQQSLVKISALTAVGNTEALKVQLDSALQNGTTINEIKEALVQLYAYCGFPRSLNAINIFKNVLDERKAIEKTVNITQANTVRKILNKPLIPVVSPEMIVRISEIEIVPEFLNEYKIILKEEASASVEKEPGVIAIFPMYQQQNPTQVRIIEIYANKNAYQNHLQTPHFKHYKTATLKMVKELKLVDMNDVDKTTMQLIFKKLK